MSEYLLDANVLIDWLQARPRAVELLERLVSRRHVLAVNAVSVAEVYSGLSAEETAAVDTYMSALSFWQITPRVAQEAGALRYAYARRGRVLALPDVLLAAHAIHRDATLVTANVRDFPMPQLSLLNPLE